MMLSRDGIRKAVGGIRMNVSLTSPASAGSVPREPGDRRGTNTAFSCCVCAERNAERPFPRRLPWLVRCRTCGTQSVWPQPTEAELECIYDKDYFKMFGQDEADCGGYRALQRVRAEHLLRRVTGDAAPGRLLDVGCGLGELLFAAARRGWSVFGVDRNPWAVAAIDRRLRGGAVCATVEQFLEQRVHAGLFDLIVCYDVLEHLRRPLDVLRGLGELLSRSGRVVVTTVDCRSLPARLMRTYWHHYHRDHLWYFHRTALRRLAERAGLDVACCTHAWKPFHLNYVLSIFAATLSRSVVGRAAERIRRTLPEWIRTRPFVLGDGLFLVATRKGGERCEGRP
ncbi:MAG: class I SAM-dependent methyltransferase [Planctomycetota bacterium]|nr:MAG: class I SAM-dependent methyltransferase [Planctomycetota bacterium]